MAQRPLGVGWKAGFWLAAAAILFFLLWLVRAVLPPFVFALVLGYLLDPLVNKLEKIGLGRGAAATLILVGSLVVLVVAGIIFLPMLGHQISSFVQALPDLAKRAQALAASLGDQVTHGWVSTALQKLGLGPVNASDVRDSASDYVNKAVAWLIGFANGLLTRGRALLDLISLAIITPVVAFYMLLDWPKVLRTVDGLVPPRNRTTVRQLAGEIDLALAGFLRGQSLVCLFLAAWYGIGLSFIGLNFGLLIGISGGLLSFVPYVGSLLVLILSLLVAIVQGWPNWQLPVMALGVVLVGQFLEGNVLSPKLVGDKVGLHPVWLIFALLAFGSVWGFTGLIVAVPVASAIGVLLRFATRRYRESPIYTGELAPATPALVLGPQAPAAVAAPEGPPRLT